MEDAFDVSSERRGLGQSLTLALLQLYQRAMREAPTYSANRLSVASFDTVTSPSPNLASRVSSPPSPAPAAAPSTTAALKESWHSTASNLRARMGRNPASAQGDRVRPVVSGPMPSTPVPDEVKGSPSFGSVSDSAANSFFAC